MISLPTLPTPPRLLRRLTALVALTASLCLILSSVHATDAAPTFLYSFTGSTDGAYPQANLIQGTDGSFYGTATSGGSARSLDGAGVVFKVTADGTMTTLHAFVTAGTDGFGPSPTLVQGTDGALYGTTASGGTRNAGTVFKITTGGAFTSLYSFTGGTDGGAPTGLALGTDGNLYGTTTLDGASSYGTVFRVTTSGTLATLYGFTGGTDGASPQSPPTPATDGNLYGTTAYGGKTAGYAGYGTVYRVTTTGTLTTLHTFTGGADGSSPSAALTQGSDGNLYGTTPGSADGSNRGTAFQLTTTGTLTTLHAFTGGTDGDGPDSGLTEAADGTLYGVTGRDNLANSTTADGTLFSLTTDGTLTTLYTFSGATSGAGFAPHTRLVQGADGNLYGTTVNGGASGFGTVFQLTGTGTVLTGNAGVATVSLSVGGDGVAVQGGRKAKLLFRRTGGDTSTDLTVNYALKGSAVNGLDYVGTDGQPLGGTVTIPVGSNLYKLKVVALTAPASSKTIKFTLQAGTTSAYTMGPPLKAKLILAGTDSYSF